MEMVAQHRIHYSNRERIPASEFARSLISLENIIKFSPAAIKLIFNGIEFHGIQVYIDSVGTGSLWEEIVVKFIFGGQEKFDETMSRARDVARIENLIQSKKILLPIAIASAMAGCVWFVSKSPSVIPEHRITIEANNTTIINVTSDLLDMAPDKLNDIIKKSIIGKERRLARETINLVKPAKRDRNSAIIFDNDVFSLSSDTIQATPSQTPDIDEEIVEDYDNVPLVLRAADLDSSKTGWAAIAPSILDRRLKLHLAPDINADKLLAKREVLANISIIFRMSETGQKQPRLIFLREVVQDSSVAQGE